MVNPMTVKTEGNYRGEFLISEAPRTFSRESATIDQNQTIKPGTVLGYKAEGSATVTPAKAFGAGNGALGAWTADAGAPAGVYRAECVAAATNAGTFDITKPDGTPDGQATVAVAYNGTVNGTIGDGSADWAVGDVVEITVSYAAGTGLAVAVNPAATDGSQIAAAIAYDGVVTGASENAKIAVIARQAEVDAALLDFGTLNSGQIIAAKAQLAALNPPIICR